MCGVCMHSLCMHRGFDEEGHHFFLIKADGAWNYSHQELSLKIRGVYVLSPHWLVLWTMPVRFPTGAKNLSWLHHVRTLFSGGTGGSLPKRKASRHEAFYSSLSTAKVKNEWSCTSTPPDVFTMCTETPVPLPPIAFLNLTNHVSCMVQKF